MRKRKMVQGRVPSTIFIEKFLTLAGPDVGTARSTNSRTESVARANPA